MIIEWTEEEARVLIDAFAHGGTVGNRLLVQFIMSGQFA